MKKERKRDHTKGKKQGLGQKSSGEDEGVERKVFLSRQIEENEI